MAFLKDAKTRLQEFLQSRHKPLPEYQVTEVTGEAHAQFFKIECIVDGIEIPGKGQGSSRRFAEQNAAQDMLSRLDAGWDE